MAATYNDDGDVLSEINITPLVDVMLVLLVSFVITIPALTNAVHINLPKTVTTTPPDQQKAVTVTVDADSRLYLDEKEIAADRFLATLQGLKASQPDLTSPSLASARPANTSVVASTLTV